MKLGIVLTVVELVMLATCAVDPTPGFMYDIKLEEKPAFIRAMVNKDKTSSYGGPAYDLGITSFTGNVFKKDVVLNVADVSEHEMFDPLMAEKTYLTDELQWPNEIDIVPEGIFSTRTYSVAGGFFLAGKDNGTVALIDMQDPENPVVHNLTPFASDKKWFYHRVLWMDMNNDGHMDAITARAYGAGDHADEAQLLWLENPGFDHPSANWQEHIIHEDTIEVSFNIHQLQLPNGQMTPVIVGSGFWSKELTLVWSSTNDWLDASSIQTLVVGTYGWYFDVQVVDVNKDGRKDLLTTTWSQLGDPGALLAYEIPDNWQDASAWTEHVIRDGYKEWPIPGKGSPGTALAFYPNKNDESEKPFIFVSGDDAGNMFVETADSQDPNDWTYSTTLMYEQKYGTVGSFSVADVNNDGWVEVFLSIYEQEFVRVLSYGPQ